MSKEKKPVYKRVWFWVVIVLIVGGIYGNNSPDDQQISTDPVVEEPKEPAAEEPKEPKEEPEEEVVVVTAEQLYKDYQDNEIKANQAYKDKMLEVTGKVTDISEMLGKTFINLDSGEEYSITSIQCFFEDEQISKVAELSKGDTVIVIGKCTGLSANVGMSDCKFKE